MGELSGRIALVTGASRGIGERTARTLAAEGATLIVTDLESPTELAEELGGRACALDVTDEQSWIDAMAFATETAGGLDILVNNAGLFLMKPITDISLEEWRRLFAVNVEGVFLGCKHAVPLLADRASRWKGGTAIVNLSSVAGIIGGAMGSCYHSSKGAVRLMTKSLALELAPSGIRVNSVHPAVIQTDMGEDVVNSLAAGVGIGGNEARSLVTDLHPLGHFGQPEDVANAIAYLASDKAAFMTGSEWVVDGGLTAR